MPGKMNRSCRPGAHALLDAATVTCAMYSGRDRSNSAVSSLELLRALEAEADAHVVAQTLADGQPPGRADSAAQQDPRRAVGAGGQHDASGAQLAGGRRDTRPPGRRRGARGRPACRRRS